MEDTAPVSARRTAAMLAGEQREGEARPVTMRMSSLKTASAVFALSATTAAAHAAANLIPISVLFITTTPRSILKSIGSRDCAREIGVAAGRARVNELLSLGANAARSACVWGCRAGWDGWGAASRAFPVAGSFSGRSRKWYMHSEETRTSAAA